MHNRNIFIFSFGRNSFPYSICNDDGGGGGNECGNVTDGDKELEQKFFIFTPFLASILHGQSSIRIL
jgi:hypothetical protein